MSGVAVIIVAGGKGIRATSQGLSRDEAIPKQYQLIAGFSLISRSILAFADHRKIDVIQCVIGQDHRELYDLHALESGKLLEPVVGGSERQASVLAGLDALEKLRPELVLIHDAARPLVSPEVIEDVLKHLKSATAVLPVVSVVPTIKHSEDGARVDGTPDRSKLYEAQTPQGFRYPDILEAHRKAAKEADMVFTDDASIAEWAGMEVALSKGERHNIKVTTPEDFALAELYLGQKQAMETRTGTGLDIHRFVTGDKVRLAEVDIPHTHRLEGHSDADAALHVLTDALLGALGEGDIGRHFPPSEPRWKGEPSATFLQFAAERVRERGGRIVHLDLTLMCEAPKIGPHADRMRENIARICGIAVSRVSVKATTSEKMGFVGRGEGLFAHGTASIEVPRGDD
ncbi:MAG: bifunctional 2-C-methyl-D-erythritol 4-phosphate cytidylyltransferase/2-C-methyl-D-erythritol 2,4-cyclodiphosphate synthase [Hyphomicrobiaceae bacterium]|nr:bifunctional 2-C-methyl-D-erythritol 4-phosphate cytidylyltransferase/2-C-methyl-D-erythritol 2,4-cyclodiphosphate synthase [Hyphomicrobiaceae bacterium]MCC0023444.1 bifunctional 2-C-methyl-D-erythritol 4-phosphate cytidylyltransferase/2-C-methyl-D-erythritol 2,4-cyclodiphosphate synthase [Hyphomicrobiaceae bacterium]